MTDRRTLLGRGKSAILSGQPAERPPPDAQEAAWDKVTVTIEETTPRERAGIGTEYWMFRNLPYRDTTVDVGIVARSLGNSYRQQRWRSALGGELRRVPDLPLYAAMAMGLYQVRNPTGAEAGEKLRWIREGFRDELRNGAIVMTSTAIGPGNIHHMFDDPLEVSGSLPSRVGQPIESLVEGHRQLLFGTTDADRLTKSLEWLYGQPPTLMLGADTDYVPVFLEADSGKVQIRAADDKGSIQLARIGGFT